MDMMPWTKTLDKLPWIWSTLDMEYLGYGVPWTRQVNVFPGQVDLTKEQSMSAGHDSQIR